MRGTERIKVVKQAQVNLLKGNTAVKVALQTGDRKDLRKAEQYVKRAHNQMLSVLNDKEVYQ